MHLIDTMRETAPQEVQPPPHIPFDIVAGRQGLTEARHFQRPLVCRELVGIGIELRDLLRAHAGACEPARRILRAKAIDVHQQAGDARAGGGTIGLERIADEHDSGLKMSLHHGQIHHPVLHPVGHAEIAEVRPQSRQQAQDASLPVRGAARA